MSDDYIDPRDAMEPTSVLDLDSYRDPVLGEQHYPNPEPVNMQRVLDMLWPLVQSYASGEDRAIAKTRDGKTLLLRFARPSDDLESVAREAVDEWADDDLSADTMAALRDALPEGW